jgi:hypothetical protein
MPLSPDLVAEFVVGPTCPPGDVLNQLAEALAAGVPLAGPGSRKSLALCGPRPALDTNIASVGLWSDVGGFSDEQLRAALADVDLLSTGQTVALLLTAGAIQAKAAEAWESTDKKVGRVNLNRDIDVSLGTDEIVSRVTGTFEVPVLPDLDFTFTVNDRLSLAPPGSDPPLVATTSTNLDVSTLSLLVEATLIGLLRPILGVITFFAVPAIAADVAPKPGGVGSVLASNWPSQLLTPIRPPDLPGKFILFWTDLDVDEAGVRTFGVFSPAPRAPSASIQGPGSVAVPEQVGNVDKRYFVDTHDLRAPMNIQWDGVADGTELTTSVSFGSAGHPHVLVDVHDADNLSASDDLTVVVSIVPLKRGHHPN